MPDLLLPFDVLDVLPTPARRRRAAHFDGPAYDAVVDEARLTGQLKRIWTLMADGRWRTLSEIAGATGDHEASISAQLRHLRKRRFGAHQVDRRARGNRARGLWEYRLPNG